MKTPLKTLTCSAAGKLMRNKGMLFRWAQPPEEAALSTGRLLTGHKGLHALCVGGLSRSLKALSFGGGEEGERELC